MRTNKIKCRKCGRYKIVAVKPKARTKPKPTMKRVSERPDPPPSMADVIRARRGRSPDVRLTEALRLRMPKPPSGPEPPRVARSTVLPPDCVPSPTNDQFRAAIVAARGGAR